MHPKPWKLALIAVSLALVATLFAPSAAVVLDESVARNGSDHDALTASASVPAQLEILPGTREMLRRE